MLESILTFLTDHKSIIVGASITVAEVATIFINFYRKNKAENNSVQLMKHSAKISTTRKFLWAANPINLFREAV